MLLQSYRIRVYLPTIVLLVATAMLAGCAALLPNSQQQNLTPWTDYAGAQAMFAQIEPGKTTRADLERLGIVAAQTPNVTELTHADLLRRLGVVQGGDQLLDPRLRACLADYLACHALQLQQVRTDRKRVGNFWLDIFNFRRQVEITGWQFDALIVLRGDVVAYKMWSGSPMLKQSEEERNPLGPLQGIGTSLVR